MQLTTEQKVESIRVFCKHIQKFNLASDHQLVELAKLETDEELETLKQIIQASLSE